MLPLALLALAGVALYVLRSRVHAAGADVSEADYPIRGVDLSAHNGKVDFGNLKEAGITFVMLKASEGESFRDSRFEENYRLASEAGLYVGAYHFFRFDVDGILQARNFMQALEEKDIPIPLAIDVEEHGNPFSLISDKVVRRLADMIDELSANEFPIVIYTNKDGYEKFIKGNFDDYPLWICSFSEPVAEMDWTLWQYSHWGNLPGVKGNVDLNIFYGNGGQWKQWLQQ